MMTCLIGDAVLAAAAMSVLSEVAPAKPVVAATSVNENAAALTPHFLAHFLGTLSLFRIFDALNLDYENADFEIARGRLTGNCLSFMNVWCQLMTRRTRDRRSL